VVHAPQEIPQCPLRSRALHAWGGCRGGYCLPRSVQPPQEL
jgi:hypothetical protein